MAYSMYEHSLMKSEKHIQYYPEEYDNANQNYNQLTVRSPRTHRKIKKTQPSILNENERKCPIYIHQFNKLPISSIYANYSSIDESNFVQQKSSRNKSKSQNSKLVLDKLEETYWATWKPNKDSKTRNHYVPRVCYDRQKHERIVEENAAEQLIKYFEKNDFSSTSGSATENTVHSNNTYKQYETITQEIQTDDLYPVNFSDYVDGNDSSKQAIEGKNSQGGTISQETVSERLSKEELIVEKATTETPENEIKEAYRKSEYIEITSEENLNTTSDSSSHTVKIDDKKIINHTDSFIITKKKQNLVKDYLQQPRCIKLYKKTVSSYLKGGSYPLKPCLKKETAPKGNFRLGAPGSPLFVIGSSFNRIIK